MFSHELPPDDVMQTRCRTSSMRAVQLNVVIKEGDPTDYPYCMMVLSSRRTRTAPSAMDSISSSPGYMYTGAIA
jgi:hypothetical protein